MITDDKIREHFNWLAQRASQGIGGGSLDEQVQRDLAAYGVNQEQFDRAMGRTPAQFVPVSDATVAALGGIPGSQQSVTIPAPAPVQPARQAQQSQTSPPQGSVSDQQIRDAFFGTLGRYGSSVERANAINTAMRENGLSFDRVTSALGLSQDQMQQMIRTAPAGFDQNGRPIAFQQSAGQTASNPAPAPAAQNAKAGTPTDAQIKEHFDWLAGRFGGSSPGNAAFRDKVLQDLQSYGVSVDQLNNALGMDWMSSTGGNTKQMAAESGFYVPPKPAGKQWERTGQSSEQINQLFDQTMKNGSREQQDRMLTSGWTGMLGQHREVSPQQQAPLQISKPQGFGGVINQDIPSRAEPVDFAKIYESMFPAATPAPTQAPPPSGLNTRFPGIEEFGGGE